MQRLSTTAARLAPLGGFLSLWWIFAWVALRSAGGSTFTHTIEHWMVGAFGAMLMGAFTAAVLMDSPRLAAALAAGCGIALPFVLGAHWWVLGLGIAALLIWGLLSEHANAPAKLKTLTVHRPQASAAQRPAATPAVLQPLPAQTVAAGARPAVSATSAPAAVGALLCEVKPALVVGRVEELERLCKVLCRSGKKAAALVGRAGIGKTAIVEKLAQAIADGEVPEQLRGKRLLAVDGAALMAGQADGTTITLVRQILAAGADPDVIVFIDELHTVMQLRGVADVLKPAIARGEITVIGATTDSEYAEIERDEALARRFERVRVDEPTDEETLTIVRGLADRFGSEYAAGDGTPLAFADGMLERAVALASQRVSRIAQPAATIEVLHKAAVEATYAGLRVVGKQQIDQAVAELAGVPVELVAGRTDTELKQALREYVVGQDETIAVIAKKLRSAAAGLADTRRPRLTLLATGPSGVGKTETARALAAVAIGDSRRLVEINMGEYAGEDGLNRLLGAGPGYVGYGDRKPLDELYNHPASVVLFDEFDLASADVQNLLFKILDEGEIRDSQARQVSFRDAIVVATTNKNRDELLWQGVRPELLNRFDEVVVYNELGRDSQRELLEVLLRPVRERARQSRNLDLELSDRALELLCERGYSRTAGARDMKRTIDRLLLAGLEEQLSSGAVDDGDTVFVDAEQGELVFAVA